MSVRSRVFGALFLAFLVPAVAVAVPLGSSFSYQGQLSQSDTPVDGTVHLRFSLWDAARTGDPPTGGTQIGSSQIAANVVVDDGLFSAAVNAGGEFGASAFNGEARWLQIEVCTDGTCASGTVLGARQPMTATPYAVGPWQLEGTSLNYPGGRVAIGTTAPAARLGVKGDGDTSPTTGTPIARFSRGNADLAASALDPDPKRQPRMDGNESRRVVHPVRRDVRLRARRHRPGRGSEPLLRRPARERRVVPAGNRGSHGGEHASHGVHLARRVRSGRASNTARGR
jgi:hypothetical protein